MNPNDIQLRAMTLDLAIKAHTDGAIDWSEPDAGDTEVHRQPRACRAKNMQHLHSTDVR